MQLKEKLIFCLWKKLNDENRDLNPGIPTIELPNNTGGSSLEIELDGETIDSSSNQNNTPKSKALGKQDSHEQSGV